MWAWRWLTGDDASALLLTALGDLFIKRGNGQVEFLDTYTGTLVHAATNVAEWEAALSEPPRVADWFQPALVRELKTSLAALAPGQCYSPILPPVVGGTVEPNNFELTTWELHLGLTGQLHEKSRRFPDVARIRRFTSAKEPSEEE